MARIRTIKPNFFKNEDLSRLDAETQILAAGLLCYADDEGYFNANPKLVQAEIFPLRDLSLTIHGMLQQLSDVGYLRLGTGINGRTYGHIVHFLDHQVINRPKKSEIKGLEISWTNHGIFTDSSMQEGKGREGNKEGNKNSPSKPRKVKPQTKAHHAYEMYPRKVGKGEALRAIDKAADRLVKGESGSPLANYDEAIAFLAHRASLFSKSESGQNGKFTPHPATWFNQSRYLDDEGEWSRKEVNNGTHQQNRHDSLGKQSERNKANRDAILAGIFGAHVSGNAAHGSGTGKNDSDPSRILDVGAASSRIIS